VYHVAILLITARNILPLVIVTLSANTSLLDNTRVLANSASEEMDVSVMPLKDATRILVVPAPSASTPVQVNTDVIAVPGGEKKDHHACR